MKPTYEMTLAEFAAQFRPQPATTIYPKWEYRDTSRPARTLLERAKALRGFHRDDIMEAINEGKQIPAHVIAEYPELADLVDRSPEPAEEAGWSGYGGFV